MRLLRREGSRRPRRPTDQTTQTGPSDGPQVLDTFLGGTSPRDVLVLMAPEDPPGLDPWLSRFHADRVTLFRLPGATSTTARRHPTVTERTVGFDRRSLTDTMELLGSQDVMVDLVDARALSGRDDRYRLFASLFLFLRRGGVYVLEHGDDHAELPPGFAELAVPVLAQNPAHQRRKYADRATESEGAATGAEPSGTYLLDSSVPTAVETLLLSPRHVVATKRNRHYLRVGSARAEVVLSAREPALETHVMQRLPPGDYEPAGSITNYGAHDDPPWPERIAYPEHVLTHYRGDLSSLGGMLLVAGDTLLPDSFRWHLQPHPNNPSAQKAGRVLALAPRRRPKRRLSGDYYFLDCVFSGHFGHLTSETVSKLWGWEQAKRELPGLKALFHSRRDPSGRSQLERTLFRAYGIAEDDLVGLDTAVWLDSVVGATPQWHNAPPYYAHPAIQETWERLTRGLLAGQGPADHERLFVSRGDRFDRRRGCRNRAEVESLFARRGFHVIYPEELPLPEQVALFAGARVVAGFAGSAMFNLMHSQRLEAAVVLSHRGYTARNEHLFTSIRSGDLHYFWSPSERVTHVAATDQESQLAGWSFDFDTLGADLASVLAAY